MARKTSFGDVEGFQSLSQQLIAKRMVALSVDPKPGQWDPEARKSTQKTNADGVPQWLVQTLFYPNEDDAMHKPEVVPVTVTAIKEPVIRPGAAVQFEDFGAWYYVARDHNHQIIKVGRSLTASGLRQNGGE